MEGIPKVDFERLRSNLDSILARIRRAEDQSGRPEGSVRLVAVTKKVGPAMTSALIDLGIHDFGENRPEEAQKKDQIIATAWPEKPRPTWHMIGHYQRKKIRSTLPLFTWIHSVHGLNLIQALEARAAEIEHAVAPAPQKILLQVNVSGEEAKQGFGPDLIAEALHLTGSCPHLRVEGLMTMAPFEAPAAELRVVFSELRQMRDALRSPDQALPELSMGMSRDFESAIHEGATMVRVGTGLFRGLSNLE